MVTIALGQMMVLSCVYENKSVNIEINDSVLVVIRLIESIVKTYFVKVSDTPVIVYTIVFRALLFIQPYKINYINS